MTVASPTELKSPIGLAEERLLQHERESILMTMLCRNARLEEFEGLELWTSEEVPTRFILVRHYDTSSGAVNVKTAEYPWGNPALAEIGLVPSTNGGETAPMRNTTTEQGGLACVHSVGYSGSILEFHDLRDAIELYAKYTTLNDPLQANDTIRFCCPSMVKQVLPVDDSVLSSIVVSIQALAEPPSMEAVVACVQEQVQLLAPCQVSNNSFLDVTTSRTAKFFAEYFDVRVMPKVIDGLDKVAVPGPFQITWATCDLPLVDRHTLFGGHDSFTTCFTARRPVSSELDLINRTLYPETTLLSGPPPNEFDIDFTKIESDADTRTTCMIRNIPNKYTQTMLIDMINETHFGLFDFIYLRMDFKNKCNVGYAFINFVEPQSIVSFARRVLGKRWPRFNSDKICHLTYARIQGKVALVEKFRHSKVMMEPASYRPKVYHSHPPYCGMEESFPY
jgi:hypothetical protein